MFGPVALNKNIVHIGLFSIDWAIGKTNIHVSVLGTQRLFLFVCFVLYLSTL